MSKRWSSGASIRSWMFLCFLISCGGTTETDGLIPDPDYSWRGRIVDSATGFPVSNISIQVREQEHHRLQGLVPVLGIERLPDNRFTADYILHGFRCSARIDTTFTLHLDFVDSLQRYQSAMHQSSWLINCDRDPADTVPEPYPREDGLMVMLRRNP